MYFNTVAHYWNAYESREMIRKIHPADDMYKKAEKEGDYWAVGEAGLSVIASCISLCRFRQVGRFLDFGCGHGRVARHVRAFFPEAKIFFCDIDKEGSGFCADTFGGEAVPSSSDFSALELPSNIDIIWLGSVCTHLSYANMNILFNRLFSSLNPGGALIITYRGRRMYELMRAQDASQIKRWHTLLTDYEKSGIAYQAYNDQEPDWGLSLNTMESMLAMGNEHADSRVLCLSEAGWAVSHDVIAWTRRIVA